MFVDLARPLRVVTPTLDGDVLSVLCATSAPLTGRQVHRLLGRASEGGVRQALERLARQGVVRREEAGRAHLYSLNREHLAAPHICALAELRGELIDRLRSEIGAWTISPPVAVLFGSTARDEARERSDLDLLVVRPDGVAADDPRWRDQLERLAGQAHAWTGNEAEILEWEERDLPRVLGREPVLAAAAREGVALAGSVQRLRAAARRTRSRAAG